MNINTIFQFLVPKDKKFFPLFEESSSNLIQIATILHEAVNLPKKERETFFLKIDELEQKGENITRRTNIELSKNFITPFDREDIHSLITAIELGEHPGSVATSPCDIKFASFKFIVN